ncbi:beta-scruin-like [Amblyomma americanum]
MMEKRAFFSALDVQRDWWLAGGVMQLRPKVKCTTCIDVLRLASSTMERPSVMPSPRHSVCAEKTGYEVYLFVGQDENNRPLGDVIMFDRARRSIMQCEPLPWILAGSATAVMPEDGLDWLRLRSIWPGKKATPNIRERAATVIQKAYRNYRRGERLQPRLKNTWPPPARSTETLESHWDANGAEASGATQYLRQQTFPENMDPNLGMVGRMDGSFLKTNKTATAPPDVLAPTTHPTPQVHPVLLSSPAHPASLVPAALKASPADTAPLAIKAPPAPPALPAHATLPAPPALPPPPAHPAYAADQEPSVLPAPPDSPPPPARRRSHRIRRKPDRWGY